MAEDNYFTVELPTIPGAADLEGWGEGQRKLALQAVGGLAYQTWVKLASDRLARKRQDFDDYWHAISQPSIQGGAVVLTLTGKRAHDLEFGRPPYDLRDVLLGPHVRVKRRGESGKGAYRNKQGGLYRPIPFRHQEPGTLGTNGPAMGDAYAQQMGHDRALDLGKWVHSAAKDLGASLEKPNRKVKWGESLPGGFAPKLKPHHAVDIYKSMYRVQKDYKNERTGRTTTQSKYITFRTISQSVKRGWIVPQTSGLHLMFKLTQRLEELAPAFLAQAQSGSSTAGPPPAAPPSSTT